MKKSLTFVLTVALICSCLFMNTSATDAMMETSPSVTNDGMNWPDFVTEEAKKNLLARYESVYGPQTGIRTRAITYTYSECFGTVEWITRSGAVSLSIMPKAPLYSQTLPNAAMAVANYAWGLLADKFRDDSEWDNEESMYAQFHCHVLAAGKYKTPWNIEPWRTETNLTTVILNGCNP